MSSDRASASETAPLVRVAEITKDYRGTRALDSVSLSISAGITGLLGPNGAGKSTLIKVLLGLVRVTRGSGEVMGRQLGRQTRAIRDLIGFMPEDDCYIDGLSGIEMLQFAARLSGLPKVEALRRGHEILDFAGLEQERYRPVETYSTGMRQKLKFALAIVHDPPLLILDEPTAGLDPEERVNMLHRISTLAAEHGKSVILSTHILPDVQMVCEAVIILARGRVIIDQSLESLSRPSAAGVTVTVLGEASQLAEHLRPHCDAVQLENNRTLRVLDAAPDLPARIWTAARELEMPVRALVPARNSLEQIFMDAVREGTHASP